MKELTTISEYHLLFLARQELLRQIDELAADIILGRTRQPKDMIKALAKLYREQLAEITERMNEINREATE